MPVTASTPAPYAPASAILALIKRHRERGLPIPIDMGVLQRAGISESLMARTLAALATLDLIDEKGVPTETFEGLRLAPEAEYAERITQWLNSVYADVLGFVDPTTASEANLHDAFRSYTPPGQRPRMVTLFTGLYAAAGMGPDKGNSRSASRKGRATANLNRVLTRPACIPSASDASPSASNESVNQPQPTQDNDKVLEYRLIDLMRDDGIEDAHREAVWTLVRYLTAKHKAKVAEQA